MDTNNNAPRPRRQYRSARYHYPRFFDFCPDPDNCVHTTDVVGEVCDCCGRIIMPPKLYG